MKMPSIDPNSKSGSDLLAIGGGGIGTFIIADLFLTGGATTAIIAAGSSAAWGLKRVTLDKWLALRARRDARVSVNDIKKKITANLADAKLYQMSSANRRAIEYLDEDVAMASDLGRMRFLLESSRELREQVLRETTGRATAPDEGEAK